MSQDRRRRDRDRVFIEIDDVIIDAERVIIRAEDIIVKKENRRRNDDDRDCRNRRRSGFDSWW